MEKDEIQQSPGKVKQIQDPKRRGGKWRIALVAALVVATIAAAVFRLSQPGLNEQLRTLARKGVYEEEIRGPRWYVKVAKKYKLPYPILNDKPGLVGKKYDAKTTPHMFIIDRRGRIAYDGAIDNAPNGKLPQGQKYVNYLAQALDELLAGKRVSSPKTKPYGCTVKYPKK